MGKPPHIHYDGAVYHVTARGVRQWPIFKDDLDRTIFLKMLDRISTRYRCKILSCCLMTNHFHLLIQVSGVSLSKMMQVLLSQYSARFNRRHGYSGHLFDDRFFRRLVRTEGYLGTVIRYINGNPVAAGMVERAVDWPWSSASQFLEGGPGTADLDAVRDLFGGDLPSDLHEAVLEVPAAAYVERTQVTLNEEPPSCPDLQPIVTATLKGTGVTLEDLKGPSRRRLVTRLRRMFFRAAVGKGASNRQAARFLNRADSCVSEALNGARQYPKRAKH